MKPCCIGTSSDSDGDTDSHSDILLQSLKSLSLIDANQSISMTHQSVLFCVSVV